MNNSKREDYELVKNFLNRTFFAAWKPENRDKEEYSNYNKLELQINAICNLKCKYCYYSRFGDKIYPKAISKPDLVLHNLDLVLNWLEKNGLQPVLEPFSGEVFIQEVGFKAIEKMIDWQIKLGIKTPITVPTNASFLLPGQEDKAERVDALMHKAHKNGIRLFLSLSVDGKFIENDNRPLRNGKLKDDEFWDRVFKYAKKWGLSFHPMVYAETIDKWIGNFLWFQNMFEKHGISWLEIYLLEVRNAQWTKEQLNHLYQFFKFLVIWSFKKSGVDKSEFPRWSFENRLFNLFSTFASVGRGTGCSVQSTVQLRLGDLTHSICHRAAYKPHEMWRFKVENDEITDIEPINTNLLFAWAAADQENFPLCEGCYLKYLCTGQCWGSMYETNNTLWTPIPTVCAVEHAKVKGILDGIIELDMFNDFYRFTNSDKKESMRLYMEEFKK
jgi:radical SAM protein with 4Fe4S-binding SPASM domain